MNDSQFTGHLGWLSFTLASQRTSIANILLRLKGIGLRAGTSLALHRKFMRLLEQVAGDREKELGILNEIEAVERRHDEMRQRNLLRCVSSTKIEVPMPTEECEREPSRFGVWTLFGLLYLFSARPLKNKNQGFTAD